MHIKSVVVCGFRSYKEEASITNFSKGQNVVIGRNGTGKSNLFDAIRFGLLTERFSNLRQDERQSLLHEGAGKHVMSAYVEITFCNRDGRFPTDSDEVVLRRTIGVKKDEFFLNQKHITKQDVHHLLESAGFSRSNPYYIVQQGKVNALALMKDKDRLELLKEVAGTNVYEARRAESYKILEESKGRREKILEVMSYIEGRLQELEDEKDELKKYQDLDKQKRALEYLMHERELHNVRVELEAIERSRAEEASISTELRAREAEMMDQIRQASESVHESEQEMESLVKERDNMEAERSQLMEAKYALEAEVAELKEAVSNDDSKSLQLNRELVEIKQKCHEIEEELSTQWNPQFDALSKTLEDTIQEKSKLTLEAEALIAKKSRKSQFKTQKERDAYLSSEIKELKTLSKQKERELAAHEASIASTEQTIDQAKQELADVEQTMAKHRHTLDNFSANLLDLQQKRNDLLETKKDRWRDEHSFSQEVKKVTELLSESESALRNTMAYEVRKGLDAVREWRDSGKYRGIHGPLIELVEPVDDRFCDAVDEAAGGAYFHVVVDTDETATRIMKELEKRNLGRVTFLPLNRLKVNEDIQYVNNDEAVPLIDKLNYNRDIRKAVIAVFGRKLLCRDLETCAEYAARTDMDCLTLNGDLVDRRGGINGGYKDHTRSRSRAQMNVKKALKRLETVSQDSKKARYAAQKADQQVTSVLGEIQKLESERRHAIESYERLRSDYDRLQSQIRKDWNHVDEKREMLRSWKQDIKELTAKREVLEKELSQKMQDDLSPEDASRLGQLQVSLNELKAQEASQSRELESTRTKKSALETVLQDNLQRRLKEIEAQIESTSVWRLNVSERQNLVKAKAIDLQQASRAVERHEELFGKLEEDIRLCELQLQQEKQDLDKIKQDMSKITKQLNDEATKVEHQLNKRRRLLQRREDVMRDIRDLGTLPTTELEQFKSLSAKEISSKFTKCADGLKKLSHVNKKALDQYISFSEQRSQLIARKQEIDEGDVSIKELIDVLDKRKDEAIFRTFKGVSHQFSQVFRELVPTGEGKMDILRAEDSPNETDTSAFTGVQIKVNFRGEGDSYLMSQLSGGQKALVALAFIFAIQRCDPAPFYLFDEIDQALDPTHRAAVASLIQRQSRSEENPAQFITSTFRPELVMVADQFYGISHQNKISDIQPLTKEESLAFIADIMADEEAVGRE